MNKEKIKKPEAHVKKSSEDRAKTTGNKQKSEHKKEAHNPKKEQKTVTKDYKKESEQLKKDLTSCQSKAFNLEMENLKLKYEIDNQNKQLAEKAKTFASKAKEELDKLKKENSQKLEQEMQEMKKYGTQNFFENFLVPFGNLELAIKAGLNQDNSAVNNYVRGFEMLANQIDNLLNEFGLEKISPQVGQEYLPEFHQAFEVIKDKKAKSNTIIEVKSTGYKLYDRVIKPAIVIVAK